jgi:hypothetical protein
VAELKQLKKR